MAITPIQNVWFDDAAEKIGADVMRWMYAGANTTQNLNFSYGLTDDAKRNLLTLWNTYSFFVMYANLDGYDPRSSETRDASSEYLHSQLATHNFCFHAV
jgi:isoleucyl-tRNA synthetase